MKSKVIVVGAGHGGLAAAALMAKGGMEVTVIERRAKNDLGYEWADVFSLHALAEAGVPTPSRRRYRRANDITFYSPDTRHVLTQHLPRKQSKISVKMERKTLYTILLKYARRCGVNFMYDCEVQRPLMAGSRVIGVKTKQGRFYADLIVDAGGMDSPIRTRLPDKLGIERSAGDRGRFNVYRALYSKTREPSDGLYKVYLLPHGETGIDWVTDEKRSVDVLVGRFGKLGVREVKHTMNILREVNPFLGRKVMRGGEFASIPVRQPLAIMVADGYAAIGDSAFMTVPIIGSGISNSLRAGKILARTVLADKNQAYTAQSLWKYQVEFYKEIGNNLAILTCMRDLLLKLTPNEIDYAFEKRILTAEDLTIGVADGVKISALAKSLTFSGAIEKVKGIHQHKELQRKVLNTGAQMAKVATVMQTLPREWEQKAAIEWAEKYLRCYGRGGKN